MTGTGIWRPMGRRSMLLAVTLGTLIALVFSAVPAHAAGTNDNLPWRTVGYPATVHSASSPSVTSYNGGEIAVWRADGSGVQPLWYSINQGTPIQLPQGAASASAPFVLLWQGRPTVLQTAAAPNNGRVLLSQFNGLAWSSWEYTPTSVLTNSSPAATVVDNDLVVAWRGTDNHIYMGGYFFNGVAQSWEGLGEVPGGGLTNFHPTLATQPDGQSIVIAHTGMNAGPNVYYQTGIFDYNIDDVPEILWDANAVWHPVPGAAHTNQAPSMSASGQQLRLAIVDSANDIEYNSATVSNDVVSWGTWWITSNIALVAAVALYLGNDNNIWAAGFNLASHTLWEKRLQ